MFVSLPLCLQHEKIVLITQTSPSGLLRPEMNWLDLTVHSLAKPRMRESSSVYMPF